MSPIAIVAISFVLIFFAVSPFFERRRAKKKLIDRIRQSWGKQPKEPYKHEDLESIAGYFLNRKRRNASEFIIDDIAWRDLDMDDIFIRLNSTETSVGEETLYRLMREPSFDVDVLQARQRLIEFLRVNGPERTAIQTILAKLGKKRLVNASDYFFEPIYPQSWEGTAYKLLVATALLSPLLLLVHTGLGALFITLSLSTNLFVYYRKKSEIALELDALVYIVRLVRCAGRLIDGGLKDPDLGEIKRTLQSQYEGIKKIGKRGFYQSISSAGPLMDTVGEYIKILLLKELIDYEFLRKSVAEHRYELIKVYDAVGLLDSLISIASFRESVPFYCEPDLKSHRPDTNSHLHFEGIYHPMIPDPVLNSLAIDRPVLVTGSNASGKSTFLKTIAVNAILAQSFHTCLARKYSSSIVAVFTSMALRDSICDGESYFVAEIKSIKRILDYRPDGALCLCLIDEVLRGTNTIERIAASSQVLLQLARQDCLCIAATHDIELTFILEDSYQNVHFQESITGDGIVFDYKLQDGRATSRNAIKLLQLLGYSKEIVEEAEKRANRFANQGTWEKELK